MDSSTMVRFFSLFAAVHFFAACSTASAPQTHTSTHTSFEPGVMPPAENAPATANVTPEGATAPVAATAPSTTLDSVPAQPGVAAPPAMEAPLHLSKIDPVPGAPTAGDEQDVVNRLQKKIDELSNQVSTLTEQLNSTQAAKRVAAIPHPADRAGDDIEPAPVKRDPEAGFVNDSAVRAYRQAMILFLSRKYPDAVLAFSEFLRNYADHPLAGSAQFYVGECYFRQKEYRLAAQEYSRVLTAYERSPQVTQALKQLASAQEQIQLSEEAARTRHLLSSLFPQSPAAEPAYDARAIAATAPAPTETHSPVETAATDPAGLAPGGEPTDDIPALAPQEAQGERGTP